MASGKRAPAGLFGRALALVELLTSKQRPLSLSEIARGTGLPKSSALRLLRGLVDSQIVQRNQHGYRLSEQLRRAIDGSAGPIWRLRRILMPFLVEVHRSVGMPVSLGVLRHGEIQFVETLYSHSESRLVHSTGTRAPAHLTASGRVALAFQPAVLQNYPFDGDREALREELAAIRAAGVAYRHGDVTGVAAPVLAATGEAVAAISIGGLDRAEKAIVIGIAETGELRRVAYAASLAVQRDMLRRRARRPS